jgi:hypothetical protein
MAFTKSDLDDSVSRGAGFHQYYSGVSLPDFSFHGIDPGLFTGNQPTDAQKQGASRFDGVKEIARVIMSGLYGVRGRQMAAAELGPLLATEKVKSIIGTWECVGEFHEGLAAVHDLGHPDCEGYGWSFINRQGVMVIPPEAVYATGRSDFIREAPRFSEGLAGLPGRFINRDGQVAIKGDWGSCHGNFHEGLAAVGRSDDQLNCTSWGFINTDGKMVIAYGSDNGSSSGYYVSNIGPELAFSDGLAAVRPEPVTHRAESGEWVLGGWGYIDHDGRARIPPEWDLCLELVICSRVAGQFSEGLAAVGRDGKWGFIDKTGKIALPFAWDYASGFLAGRARVEQKKRWGFVDRNGIPLGPIEWDRASNLGGVSIPPTSCSACPGHHRSPHEACATAYHTTKGTAYQARE